MTKTYVYIDDTFDSWRGVTNEHSDQIGDIDHKRLNSELNSPNSYQQYLTDHDDVLSLSVSSVDAGTTVTITGSSGYALRPGMRIKAYIGSQLISDDLCAILSITYSGAGVVITLTHALTHSPSPATVVFNFYSTLVSYANDLDIKKLNRNGDTMTEALRINSLTSAVGALTTDEATFDIVNTNATSVNIGGAATTFTAGATTGTANIRNSTVNIAQTSGGVTNLNSPTVNVSTGTTGVTTIVSTKTSTASSNGALVVNGGTGLLGTLNVAGLTVYENVTDNTLGTIDGAVKLLGGLAVTKNATIGLDLRIKGGDLTIEGTPNIQAVTPTAAVGLFNTTTGTVTVGATTGTVSVSSTLHGANVTDNTLGTLNGGTQVLGGLSVTKNMTIGIDLRIKGGDLTIEGTPNIQAVTPASVVGLFNTTTGNITVGAGTSTPVLINGEVTLNTDVTNTVTVNGYALKTPNTTFSLLNVTTTTLNFGGAATAINIGASTGTTTFTSTTTSSTYTNGSVKLLGGLGVAGNSNFGGMFKVENVTDNTLGALDGSAQFLGGVSVTKNMTVGLDLRIKGSDITIEGAPNIQSTVAANAVGLFNTTTGTVTVGATAGTVSVSSTLHGANVTDNTLGTLNGGTQVLGGLSVTKNATIGLDLRIKGGDLTIEGAPNIQAVTTTAAVGLFNTTTGNITVGAGTSTPVLINGEVTLNTDVTNTITVNGYALKTPNTTFDLLNTVTTTINFGGAATTVNIGANTLATTIIKSNVTSSTSSNGAFVVNGGTGLKGTLNVAGLTVFENITDNSLGTIDGAVKLLGGLAVTKNMTIGLDLRIKGSDITIEGAPNIQAVTTTAAVGLFNTTTGTVTVGATTGTVSVSSTLHGANVTDNTLGSLDGGTQVLGGLAVTKNMTVGLDLRIKGGDLTIEGTPNIQAVTTTAAVGLFNTTTGTVTVGATTGTVSVSSTLHGANTTDNTLGSLDGGTQVLGGLAVTKNATIGLDLRIKGGDLTIEGAPNIHAVTPANAVGLFNTTTGTVTVGATAGTVSVSSTLKGANTTDNTLGSLDGGTQVLGGLSVTKNITAGSNVRIKGGTLSIEGNPVIQAVTPTNVVSLFNTTTGTINIGANNTTTTNVYGNVLLNSDNTNTVTVNGNALKTPNLTFDLLNVTTTTINFGGAATAINIGGASSVTYITSGTLTSTVATGNLFNTTATTLNFGGAATAINIGASTGTTTFNHDVNLATGKVYKIAGIQVLSATTLGSGVLASSLTSVGVLTNLTVAGNVTLNNGTLVSAATTGNLFNTTATTLNIGGAATAVSIGASTGTTTFNHDVNLATGKVYKIAGNEVLSATTLGSGVLASSLTSVGILTNLTVAGNVTLNNGTLVSAATTGNLFNTTATTVNIGGAATAINIGASTGTTTVNNDINLAASKVYKIAGTQVLSATTLGSGVLASSLTSVGVLTNLTVAGTVTLNNGTLVSSISTANLANTGSTTVNIGGAATAVSIGAATGTTTVNNTLVSNKYDVGSVASTMQFTKTVASTSTTELFNIDKTIYRSAEVVIQAKQGSNYSMTKFIMMHDGTDSIESEFGSLGTAVGTYNSSIVSNAWAMNITQIAATSTDYKIFITAVKA